jgi:hypothetical protein
MNRIVGWPVFSQAVGGGGEHPAHVGDVGFHAAEAFEPAAGLAGDDLGEGRLSGAGRAEEDHRLDAVGFDGAAEELAGREDVLLADVFVEGSGVAGGRRAVRNGWERRARLAGQKKARRRSAGPKRCPTVNAVYRQFL